MTRIDADKLAENLVRNPRDVLTEHAQVILIADTHKEAREMREKKKP